ncbi:MAG: DUF6438 domain-containing protein, partial [Bacteroidota bacterium]
MRLTLLLLLSLSLGLSACKTTQQLMYESLPADFTVVIKRTPCMGTCPYYDLSVSADGTVIYIGRSHVKLQGEHRKQLPAEKVVALREVISSSDFWTWNETYDDPRISDLPSVSVGCTMNGRSHEVMVRTEAPDGYSALVQTLEDLIRL